MGVKIEEKRRFYRLKLAMPLRYQLRGTSEFNNALSNDISVGGLGFINNKFIAPLTLVSLEINIPFRTLNPIGRIVWSSPLSHSDRYRLGIEFLEIDPKEKNYLQDYINMQINKLKEGMSQ